MKLRCPSGKKRLTREVAQRQRDHWHRNGDPKMRAYRCPICDGWHIGHTTRVESRRAKSNRKRHQ